MPYFSPIADVRTVLSSTTNMEQTCLFFLMPLSKEFMNVVLFHMVEESAEKRGNEREEERREGENVCLFKGNETTTHILFTFWCLSCGTVHHIAAYKIWCLNLQYKHLYLCTIQYLQCVYQGSGNIFLSLIHI